MKKTITTIALITSLTIIIKSQNIDFYNDFAIKNFQELSKNQNNLVYFPANDFMIGNIIFMLCKEQDKLKKTIQKIFNLSLNSDSNINFIEKSFFYLKSHNFTKNLYTFNAVFIDTSVNPKPKGLELIKKNQNIDTTLVCNTRNTNEILKKIHILAARNNILTINSINKTDFKDSSVIFFLIATELNLSYPSYFNKIIIEQFNDQTNKPKQIKYFTDENYYKHTKSINYEAVIIPSNIEKINFLYIISEENSDLDFIIKNFDYNQLKLILTSLSSEKLLKIQIPAINITTVNTIANNTLNTFSFLDKDILMSNLSSRILKINFVINHSTLKIDGTQNTEQIKQNINQETLKINRPYLLIVFNSENNQIIALMKQKMIE